MCNHGVTDTRAKRFFNLRLSTLRLRMHASKPKHGADCWRDNWNRLDLLKSTQLEISHRRRPKWILILYIKKLQEVQTCTKNQDRNR